MTDYLISIASDYWTSQFHADFPQAAARGFLPAGKFGIGFLSAFMLGDEITVESNRSGGERLALTLRGVGRRGELRKLGVASGSGTRVRVRLKDAVADKFGELPDLVKIYAPMLNHDLSIDVDGLQTDVPTGWLFQLPTDAFRHWTMAAIQAMSGPRSGRYARAESMFYSPNSRAREEDVWGDVWPEYTDASTRLLASFSGTSLLCLKGLALQSISTPGFLGVIDVETAVPDVRRRQALQADIGHVLLQANAGTHSQIVKRLDNLATTGILIDKLTFLESCMNVYGSKVLRESSVPWIATLRLPGSLELVSSTQMLAELGKKESLFVAFGTDPWTALKKWVEPGQRGGYEMAVVLKGTGHDPGYRIASEVRAGTLAELWPTYQRPGLFNFILLLAAEAWQMSVAQFGATEWEHQNDMLSGRLSRK